MVKINTVIAFLAIAVVAAFAQEQAQSSSAAPSSSQQAAQPQSSSQAAASPSSSSAAHSSSAAEGSGAASSQPSGFCSAFVGDPNVHAARCTYSSTSVPPYNFSSIASYLVAGYDNGKQGHHIEDVAGDFANEVLEYYPTLTVSHSVLQSQFEKYISELPQMPWNGQSGADFNKIAMISTAAVAVIAGGALLL
ncbi:hypothetical protein MCUN1_000620 [Malassezia cuniculi]|uniref:Uncharacterized protein n=1 Tax=Malassezia cuniculi TaxID=948313 RepID=A0AAF0ERI0_9BASI|nr:hypothetical protein MCUN1_000620 [Malassezia cuniculi]